MNFESFISLGIVLILLGMAMLILGTLFAALSSGTGEKDNVHAGGVIFLGPIPLVFGSDKNMAFIAAGLGLLLMFFYFLLLKK